MMRQTLDAGSAQALMVVSAREGLRFQRRTVTGGTSLSTGGGAGTAPEWVKLTRAGQVITASVSSDGTTWRVVGSDTFSMVGAIHVGLAVSSHPVAALATGTFDNVMVGPIVGLRAPGSRLRARASGRRSRRMARSPKPRSLGPTSAV